MSIDGFDQCLCIREFGSSDRAERTEGDDGLFGTLFQEHAGGFEGIIDVLRRGDLQQVCGFGLVRADQVHIEEFFGKDIGHRSGVEDYSYVGLAA